jgi:hypothetical protein
MLDYNIIQKDMSYDLAYLQLRALSEHKMINQYAYLDRNLIYTTQNELVYSMHYGGKGLSLSYQQEMAGYIMYFYNNDDNILSICDLYARNKKYLEDPSCMNKLGQSLLHKAILDNPKTEEIILQSTVKAKNFYNKMGFESCNQSKEYEMTMPRNHIEMWLDTPLYERPKGLPVYDENSVSSKRGQSTAQPV